MAATEPTATVARIGACSDFLPAEHSETWLSDLLEVDALATVLRRARELADWVLIDAPSLDEVLDHRPSAVDSLILAASCRLRHRRTPCG